VSTVLVCLIYHLIQLSVLISTRFTKACRHKGRWINVAICFGIDLQEMFRLGICSDRGNLAADDNEDEDEDRIRDMYVVYVLF